jgi:two-component system cell cycle sensor histidine kinase/response regulator CckA
MVLVVDDDDSVRMVTRAMLERLGYTVLLAADVEEATASARSSNPPVALLLADIDMAGVSGTEVAERLRGEHPGLRVLYMSGQTRDAAFTTEELADGVDFIQKPYSRDALARKVREVLDRRH